MARRYHGQGRLGTALVLAVLVHGLCLWLLSRVAWQPPRQDRPPLLLHLEARPLAPLPAMPRMPPPLPRPAPPPPLAAEVAMPPPALAGARPAAAATKPAPRPEPASASPTPTLAPRVAIFDRGGRLRVPASVLETPAAPVPSWIDGPRTPAPWDQRIDPLVYAPTALEPLWKPDGENLLQEFIRRNTRTKTFKLPDGTRVTCGWVLLLGGCSW